MKCLACQEKMKYLKEYRFDSRPNQRGLFETIFDIEEHLVMDIYVCPKCKRLEFIYKGALEKWDG